LESVQSVPVHTPERLCPWKHKGSIKSNGKVTMVFNNIIVRVQYKKSRNCGMQLRDF